MMRCKGYKVSGYDAAYREALFSIQEQNRVLEVMDVESGQTFVLELDTLSEQKNRIRGWRKREQESEHHGTSITFGSVGIFEQLKYEGKKMLTDKPM